MLGLPFQRLPPHHKGGGFDLASSLVQVKPVRFTAKLGILKRSTELCTSRREQWHQHRVHQAAAAGEGGGNSPPYSSNSSSSSEIKHSWLQSLLAQPFVAKLAQRIPKLVRAAQEQVLLFVLFGAAAAVSLVIWAKGSTMYRNKPYSFHVKFPEAEGIDKGVPLRLKGVRVGEVQNVAVDMHTGVMAQVEVFLGQTLIPKHPQVKIEYNRTGMMSPEPFIDVTVPSRASPYAQRTPLRRTAQTQRRQQQQQQQQQHVDTTDAAAAVVESSLIQGDGASSDEVLRGSEAGTEDMIVSEESHMHRAQSRPSLLREGGSNKASSSQARHGSGLESNTDSALDKTKGVYIRPGDVVEGTIGGSTDILTRMTVKSNRGPGKIQPQR